MGKTPIINRQYLLRYGHKKEPTYRIAVWMSLDKKKGPQWFRVNDGLLFVPMGKPEAWHEIPKF